MIPPYVLLFVWGRYPGPHRSDAWGWSPGAILSGVAAGAFVGAFLGPLVGLLKDLVFRVIGGLVGLLEDLMSRLLSRGSGNDGQGDPGDPTCRRAADLCAARPHPHRRWYPIPVRRPGFTARSSRSRYSRRS